MNIGLLHEGEFDRIVIEVIIRRVFSHLKDQIDFPHFEKPGGPFDSEKIIRNALDFFLSEPQPCDLIVIITDDDKSKHRCKVVNKYIKSLLLHQATVPIIHLCNKPHLEILFFLEKSAVCNYFELPHDKQIVLTKDGPKKWLEDTYKEFIQKKRLFSLSMRTVYRELSTALDFSKLNSRSKEFKAFIYEINKHC